MVTVPGFIFGKPVKDLKDFYDREELLRSLVDYIGKGQSYALIGFRRIGKTSILNALQELLKERGFLTSFIDLELRMEKGYLDPVFFLRSYSFSILEDYFNQIGSLIRLKHLIREVPSKVVLTLSEILGQVKNAKFEAKSPIGSLELHLEFEKALYENRRRGEVEDRLLEATLRLPEALCEESGRKFVVFIDEFQFIKDLKIWRKGIFHTMRSVYQHQKKTVYVISGSAVGMISDILNSKEAPFYMSFMPVEVKPFTSETSRGYLHQGFITEGLSATEDELNLLAQSVDGIPTWLSYIGQRCVFKANEQKKKTVDGNLASEVIDKMYQDPLLRSEIEKDLAKLEAATKSRRILHVLETMAKYDASSPSKIAQLLSKQEGKPVPESKILQLYLARLLEYGYVQKESRGKYVIVDPILAQYLKRRS